MFYAEYFIKDHLGNVRSVITSHPESHLTIQGTDYYPFGLEIPVYGDCDNQLKYNSKELQNEADLTWYDYGARFYDPVIGRWHVVDAFAEKYYDYSPYSYGANDPINNIDINGDSIIYSNNLRQNDINSIQNYLTTLSQASPAFGEIINHLNSSTNNITIDIGPTYQNVPGQYDASSKTITYLNASSVTNASTTAEEFIHAYQDDIKKSEYPSVSKSNIEFEAKLFKVLIYDDASKNNPIGTNVGWNLLNESGMNFVDNAIIYGNTPLTDSQGNIDMSTKNLNSTGFQKFYQNGLNNFVSYWKQNNGPPTYTTNPSNDQPRAILKIQTALGR